MAARTMGYRTIVVDPDPSAPAGAVADEHLVAAYDDPRALQRLVMDCDVVTTEFENPPADALDTLAESVLVSPSPAAVRIAQDRIAEKRFLVDNGFPVGPFVVLDGEQLPGTAELTELVERGAVIKTARFGYDGKGQRRVTGMAETQAAWAELGGGPCVVEQLLALRTELSVIVARTRHGDTAYWSVAENTHVDGILDVSVVPARVSPDLLDRAEGLAMAVAHALDYVGVLAVEMFVVDVPPDASAQSGAKSGQISGSADQAAAGGWGAGGWGAGGWRDGGTARLLINELAPRPHNSGHWTLDGSVTSQYEQQIRAICDVGLGDTSMTSPAVAMVNLLGHLWDHGRGPRGEPDWAAVLDDPRAKLHLYGKLAPRPGRKMGHITVLSDNTAEAVARATARREAL
jgi:5-(carboxyamino)imidazole ribonucleotide synthase